jgi:hypothetical protein
MGWFLGILDILLQVEVLLPIGDFAIEVSYAVIDDGISEEAQTKCKGSSLDHEIARHNER